MRVETGYGYEVQWKLELVDADSGVIKQTVEYHRNLVVDAGIIWRQTHTDKFSDTVGSTFAFPYIGLGTGNMTSSPPIGADTTLVTEIARKIHGVSSIQGGIDLSTYIPDDSDTTAPFVIVGTEFGKSEANSSGISECGLFTLSSAGVMFCHDKIRDSGGTVTTIDKTNKDLLRVFAKITVKRLASRSDVYWTISTGGYTVEGIITNQGLKHCLDQEHWNTSMMNPSAPLAFGDGTADPLAADTGLKGGTLSLANTGVWQALGNCAIDCVCDFDVGGASPGAGNTIKEMVPLGSTVPTCQWRMTIDSPFLIKLNTNAAYITITYAVAAIADA